MTFVPHFFEFHPSWFRPKFCKTSPNFLPKKYIYASNLSKIMKNASKL